MESRKYLLATRREDAMKDLSVTSFLTCLLGASVLCLGANASLAQGTPPADHPAVTVKGKTYTPRSFLIATPQGHILIDSTYERSVPAIEQSVGKLGFKFSDIKILLGNHAHGDHQEGDALVKQMTGAQVMAMAEDVPLLQAMKPGGKEHPIDRVLHDGDAVTLGGATLIAHLTPGHTPGCTTWTATAQDGGKTYNVMFGCSLRPPAVLTPALVEQFNRAFKTVRALPCDVQLGDHGAQYNMQEKYAKMKEGGPNPFIDPATCTLEADVEEAMFNAILAEQQQAGRP